MLCIKAESGVDGPPDANDGLGVGGAALVVAPEPPGSCLSFFFDSRDRGERQSVKIFERDQVCRERERDRER